MCIYVGYVQKTDMEAAYSRPDKGNTESVWVGLLAVGFSSEY